ncbi:unnamed protein product [Sphagnum balticum]
MPASPNLFKVLTAEDPKSLLEDEIGCMTGIFQIFDRSQAFTGRRYGSKRVTSAAEQELSNSQEEEGEEDHVPTLVCSNSSQEEEEEEEEEESNNSNRLMKSMQDLVVDRSSSSVPHSKEYPKPSPLLMVSSREMCAAAATPEGSGGSSRQHCNSKDVQKLPSSLDIRDVVRASFHRERPRDSSGKEKPRASVDLGHGSSSTTNNVQSKSLPRSSSVNGRVDGFRMSVDGREELLESLRAADFKDLLRASQKVRGTTTDAPRFSVDGTRDPPHVHLSPRLSVDGRDSPRGCRIPPRLKLDGRDATRAHGKLSSRSDGGGAFLQLKKENNAAERDHQGQGEACRRIPNVVARLMGLEELPSSHPGSQAHPTKVADYHTLVNPPPPPPSSSSSSSRSEARLLQGLLQYTPATVVSPPLPPPPSQSDDYNYKQQQVLSDHVVLTALKHTDEEKTTQPLSEEEPLCGLMDQEMHQLRLKNSVQGRKLLRHILHAMQLKGLLHHPPGRNRKQSSEDVKAAAAATQQQQQLQVTKATTVEESKSRMQALKQQFLPSPRLTTAAVRKRGNSLVPAETCKDNKDNKKTVATQQQQDQQHHLPMMMTMETNLLQELVVNSSNEEQINSCCSVQQDDGPIMLGNIPDTLIIVPKPITEMEDDNIITTAITTLSSSSPPAPAQTGDLDCVSSQSSSSARSAVTSSQLDAELDERGSGISEVLTPRGVSVKKTYESGHELGPADQLVEQPSPVSVLDNFHFQEEDLTPSPSKTSSNAFDESLHRDHLEEAKAALKGLADIRSRDLCNQQQDYLCHNNKQSVEIRVPIDNAQQAGTHYSLAGNNNTVVHGICLWSKDEEREYVRDTLVGSRVITEDDDDDDDTSSSGINNCRLQWGRSSGYNNIMDVNQFDDLEARWRRRQQQQASSFNNTKENDFFLFERRQTCLENEAVGRRVLFDGTNEILVQKLDPVKFNPLPWIGGRDRPQPQEKPSGQQLIQQVWDELQDVPCVASEDVCDTIYTILHKDLRNTEKKWSDMDGEVSEVSLDLERMIVKDLIDEIVKDLTVQATTTTTTTQLIDEAAAAATR